MVRPSWVEVDLSAVAHNVIELARLVAPAGLCAVVKADAYGHGDVPVAEAALAAGASRLAVALVEEGIRLREGGIDAPILLLSEPPLEDAASVVEWDLIPTVYRPEFVAALDRVARGDLAVHLKVDTGMHRVGTDPEKAVTLAQLVDGSTHLRLEAVWSHLAVAEEDPAFTELQIARFESVVGAIESGGVPVPIRHLANTAGAVLYPAARYEMVRIGLGIYGLHPSDLTRTVVELHPAMKVLSQVAYLRRIPAGERPSYGRRRPLPADATVATVPIGYADGLPRLLSNRGGKVAIGGRRFPLAGTVTMDQIVVDCGDEEVLVGEEVVLMGSEVPADEWAARLDTITYEIVCQIGPRLPRKYQP